MLDWSEKELPTCVQADLLGINRSSIYYKPVLPSGQEVLIKNRIDEIYTGWPYLGYRRIHAVLLREDLKVSAPTVLKYMREMEICAIYPKPKTSIMNLENKKYPYLLRKLKIAYPNHVWGTDITYIRLKNGWMYLCAYIDWYSRYVIAWELSQTLEIEFVLEALNQALGIAVPEIMNSDQGSHYTSTKHTEPLLKKEVKISMDGVGRYRDNIFTERLWRSVKYENVYINNYETPRECRIGIREYFEDYNNFRPHQSLEYHTPSDIYFGKCKLKD